MRTTLSACALAFVAACTAPQQEAARGVIPPLQTLLAGYTGLSPAAQCTALNAVREYYPARLAEVVERLGTRGYICLTPEGAPIDDAAAASE